jgi:type VI secretion system protein VasJ
MEAWGKPVAEGSPCGEDCSFSPEFEAVRDEVDKDTSLHASEKTDWVVVSRLSSVFLTTHSKDIWILTYAVYAEYRLNGLDACPPAFSVLTHILDTWWNELYPPASRLQRRLAPLFWLCARMEHSAETTGFIDGSAGTVQALRKEFAQLQSLLDSKAGEAAPSFINIFSKIAEDTTVHSSPESTPAAPRQAVPDQALAKPITASLADMDKDGRIPAGILPQLVRNILEHCRQLAGHFLSLNPVDERVYQLSRTALWPTILQLPQVDASGKTQLTIGVPADRVQAYRAAVDGKQYAEILPHLERSAEKAPFWFDGHAMVVRCLEGLDAAPAAAHVRDSLASLLRRFPELLTYKFKDNTPFCSPRILPWLEALAAPVASGKVSQEINNETKGVGDTDEEATLQEAIACNMEEGFQAGLRRLGAMPPGRSRTAVLNGVLQARYCLAAGKKNAAVKMLFGLYRQMEQWELLDWEPDLTARILALLLSSQSKNQSTATEEMKIRLYLLNLDLALNVIPEN